MCSAWRRTKGLWRSRIVIFDEDDGGFPDEFELYGLIQEVGTDSIVVFYFGRKGELEVGLVEETEVCFYPSGESGSTADLAVGSGSLSSTAWRWKGNDPLR